MSEIRKDPIVNRWVIVSTQRARRVGSFIDPVSHQTPAGDCPFCHHQQEHVIDYHKHVVVLNSQAPLFKQGVHEEHMHGLYAVKNAVGNHEVIIETPAHMANMADLPVNEIADVFACYSQRINWHRAKNHTEYVLAYKNYGVAAGSRNIGHSRSQVMSLPVIPVRVKDKLAGARSYWNTHERCVFCDMVTQEVKDGRRIVAQNEKVVAFVPYAARFPFEVMVLPKVHHHDYGISVMDYVDQLAEVIKDVLMRFQFGLNDPAYNVILQTAPFRKWPTLVDDYHWHIEITPRLTKVAGFERGTGFYMSPISSEMAAQYLREVYQ